MLQDQQCLWESGVEEIEDLVNFKPVLEVADYRSFCLKTGDSLTFPIQDVIVENYEPSIFIIHGLPLHQD